MIKRLYIALAFLAAATAALGNRVVNRQVEEPFDVDLFVNFEFGTAGDVITAANLNANTIKRSDTTGAWTEIRSTGEPALTRVNIASGNFTRRAPVRVDGVTYSAGGTRKMVLDMTGRMPLDGLTEGIQFALDMAGLDAFDGEDVVVGMMVQFDSADAPGGGDNMAIDFLHVDAHVFAVLQHFRNQGTVDQGSIHAHGQLTGGASSDLGVDVPTPRGQLFSVYNRASVSGQLVEGFLVNSSTGYLAGYTKGVANVGGLQSFKIWEYLFSFGGELLFDGIVVGRGSRASVREPMQIAAATWDGDPVQHVASGIQLAWLRTVGCSTDLDVRVDGGSWASVLTDYAGNTYNHTGLTDGSTYEYRLTVRAAEYSSPASATSVPVTIDDAAFLVDRTETWDGRSGGGIPIGSGQWAQWETSVGNSAEAFCFNNGRVLGVGGLSINRWVEATFGEKQRSMGRYRTGGTGTFFGGPMVRIQAGTASGYGVFVDHNGSEYTLRIYKVTDNGSAAVATQIGAQLHGGEITLAHDDEIEIKAINTGPSEVTLTAYRNGAQLGTPRTDTSSPYMSGQPGFGLADGSYLGPMRMREVSN